MTITVMKLQFPKEKRKIISDRDYKKVLNETFRAKLDNELLNHEICSIEYQHF